MSGRTAWDKSVRCSIAFLRGEGIRYSGVLTFFQNLERGPGSWNPALDLLLQSNTARYCAGDCDGGVDGAAGGVADPAGGACVAAGAGLLSVRGVNLKCC